MDKLVDGAVKYASYGAHTRGQSRKWVLSKQKCKHWNSILKHAISHHFDPAVKREIPCKDSCGFSMQEIVNMLDFSSPCHSVFYYNTVYRQYPRFMKLTPSLDHTIYNRMVVEYHPPFKIMTHFAVTLSPWLAEFDRIIEERFSSNFFEDAEVQQFMQKPKPTRSGMMNRWKSNPAISHMLDVLHVQEVMLA